MPISISSSWKPLRRRLQLLLRGWQPQAESAEYRAWRHQFLLDRLRIALWIAFPAAIALTANGLFAIFGNSQQLQQDLLTIYGDASLFGRMRSQTLVNIGATFAVLLSCWGLLQSRWGRSHPTVIFLLFSSILTWSDAIVGTLFRIPSVPDPRFFLAQAVLIPVCWRLHLISQLVPIAHYVILYPLLGLTKIGNREFYSTYSIQHLIDFCWIGVICILSVYLYERLKCSEFESQRQLRSVIHAISHDLKNPAMGTSTILQSLLFKLDRQLLIDRTILEQLLAGSHRQINLINSLLEAQSAEANAPMLHCQTLQLDVLVEEAIADLAAIAQQHRIALSNYISSDLPLVNADKTQIWRVFNNLILNAIKHNPRGTQIEIKAEVIQDRKIRCTIGDNGIGIPKTQLPYIFKLYTRGAKARRMPGLGLGLYLCEQIIAAHQGEIGVNSQLDKGSTFWFTLPVAMPECYTNPDRNATTAA
jgi:signal transduction histidine kinase